MLTITNVNNYFLWYTSYYSIKKYLLFWKKIFCSYIPNLCNIHNHYTWIPKFDNIQKQIPLIPEIFNPFTLSGGKFLLSALLLDIVNSTEKFHTCRHSGLDIVRQSKTFTSFHLRSNFQKILLSAHLCNISILYSKFHCTRPTRFGCGLSLRHKL